MIYNFTHFGIVLLSLLPAFASEQTETVELSLEQSLTLLQSGNIRTIWKNCEKQILLWIWKSYI